MDSNDKKRERNQERPQDGRTGETAVVTSDSVRPVQSQILGNGGMDVRIVKRVKLVAVGSAEDDNEQNA
jgi:hypothetical protein